MSRTFRRERYTRPLRITAAADARRLRTRWRERERADELGYYHRRVTAWAASRAQRAGLVPIDRTEETATLWEPGDQPDVVRAEIRISVWRPEDGLPVTLVEYQELRRLNPPATGPDRVALELWANGRGVASIKPVTGEPTQ